ncbi:phosphatidylglycerophosphate synthase [Dunaliella salina]|uniref:Phosphatidylglycerophosphate synthase n=1 Tax=Dunaliella salina TaxID=3046 RepID=A0ABQ7GBH2_DUNSA|nr:phosphatidylglycerophosphate synthase [Dunaliella salina]|eukprot:KAF5831953.1 phosphatidylglycerophosphate synthase [Dunaliella salina]
MTVDSSDETIPRIPLVGVKKEQESILSPLDRRSETYRHLAAEAAEKQARRANARQPVMTIPNILTFLRLIFVPVLVVVWDLDWLHSPIICAAIFMVAAWTDWLDGYLARRLGISTVFGAFLDPVADKIMVTTSLILLTTSPPAPLVPRNVVLPVAIIICREITMASLREWAAASGGGAHKAVKVNSLGKWKTACQMLSMSALLVVRQPQAQLQHILPAFMSAPAFLLQTTMVSYYLLWASAVLAVWSLSFYMMNVWTHFVYPNASKAH